MGGIGNYSTSLLLSKCNLNVVCEHYLRSCWGMARILPQQEHVHVVINKHFKYVLIVEQHADPLVVMSISGCMACSPQASNQSHDTPSCCILTYLFCRVCVCVSVAAVTNAPQRHRLSTVILKISTNSGWYIAIHTEQSSIVIHTYLLSYSRLLNCLHRQIF